MTVTEALTLMKTLAQQIPAIESPYLLKAPRFAKPAAHSEIGVLEEDVEDFLPEGYKDVVTTNGDTSRAEGRWNEGIDY